MDHFCQWITLFTCILYNGHLYPFSLALQAMGCVLAAPNESLLPNSSPSEMGGEGGGEELIEIEPEQAGNTYVN